MKIYVASKTDNWQSVAFLQERLREGGHKITCDWTVNVKEVGGAAVSDQERQAFADADLQGVRECDVFILLCYTGMCGAYIEFGAALADGKTILVAGKPERDSVFFECDGVIRVPFGEGALFWPHIRRALERITHD